MPTTHPLESWGEIGERLRIALAGGRLAPAYLIQGVDLEACGALARTFAAALVSDVYSDELRERVAVGAHPDVKLVTKDKPTVISVAALEEVLRQAHQTPMEGNHQVFILWPADAMEPAGIARYLKTLEEPPASTVFLLCTRAPERLPATIHSRCASIHVPPERASAIASALSEQPFPASDIERAAALCGGARSRALLLLERELLAPFDAFVEDALADPPSTAHAADALLAVLRHASDGPSGPVRERDLADEVLRLLAQILRDCAAERPLAVAESLRADQALTALARIADCSRALALNVSPRAVLVEAALALREAATP